jgi:DNA-binding MarR family transcriptional regulator
MGERMVSNLESHLGYWMRYVSNHVSHAFARRLAEEDVTVAEWAVMRLLLEKPAAPSQLASDMGMTRGAITKLADRLIAKSLAIRTQDKQDRRAQTLALTAKGRTLTPKLAQLADKNDAAFFGHLSADERQHIERILKDIIARHGLLGRPID